jgi:hypothetical protein
LNQDVQHDPVLVYRSSKVMQHTSDPNEHLVQMPCIPKPRPTAAQPFGKFGAELSAPGPDALVGDQRAAISQESAQHLAG